MGRRKKIIIAIQNLKRYQINNMHLLQAHSEHYIRRGHLAKILGIS